MKKILILACLVCIFAHAEAQKLIIGDKAPELKVKGWLYSAPTNDNTPKFIEFFYSSSAPCVERIATIDGIAKKYGALLNVIVVSRESADRLREVMNVAPYAFYVGMDDASKTFSGYGVQYVPFGVLVDTKGRIVWFGNPASLNDDVIKKYVKQ